MSGSIQAIIHSMEEETEAHRGSDALRPHSRTEETLRASHFHLPKDTSQVSDIISIYFKVRWLFQLSYVYILQHLINTSFYCTLLSLADMTFFTNWRFGRVSQCHFSNYICSPGVSASHFGNPSIISNFIIIIILWWSGSVIMRSWKLRWWRAFLAIKYN